MCCHHDHNQHSQVSQLICFWKLHDYNQPRSWPYIVYIAQLPTTTTIQRLHKLRSLWSQGNYLFLFLYCILDNPKESKRISCFLSRRHISQPTFPPDPTIHVSWMRVCFVKFLSSRRKIQILPITGANIIMMCSFFLAPKLTEHQQQHQAWRSAPPW